MANFSPVTDNRICIECKEMFKMKRKWQRFCRDKCRITYHFREKEVALANERATRDMLEKENAELLALVKKLEAENERLK